MWSFGHDVIYVKHCPVLISSSISEIEGHVGGPFHLDLGTCSLFRFFFVVSNCFSSVEFHFPKLSHELTYSSI